MKFNIKEGKLFKLKNGALIEIIEIGDFYNLGFELIRFEVLNDNSSNSFRIHYKIMRFDEMEYSIKQEIK